MSLLYISVACVIASAAAVFNQCITAPLEVIATSVQMSRLPIMTVVNSILKKEGVFGFYKGFGAAIILCSNPAITNAAFDRLKHTVQSLVTTSQLTTLTDNESLPPLTAFQSFVIGAMSKALATVVTYPYIRAKILVQVQSLRRRHQEHLDEQRKALAAEEALPLSTSIASDNCGESTGDSNSISAEGIDHGLRLNTDLYTVRNSDVTKSLRDADEYYYIYKRDKIDELDRSTPETATVRPRLYSSYDDVRLCTGGNDGSCGSMIAYDTGTASTKTPPNDNYYKGENTAEVTNGDFIMPIEETQPLSALSSLFIPHTIFSDPDIHKYSKGITASPSAPSVLEYLENLSAAVPNQMAMLKAASFCIQETVEPIAGLGVNEPALFEMKRYATVPISGTKTDPVIDEPDKGFIETMTSTVMQDGIFGLYRGLRLQLLKTVLAAAILYMIKERIHITTSKVEYTSLHNLAIYFSVI